MNINLFLILMALTVQASAAPRLTQSPKAASAVVVPPAIKLSASTESPVRISAIAQYQDRGIARLAWNMPADSSVVGVRLKYGTASGVYPNVATFGIVTNASFNNLLEATTYFFVCVTYSITGTESPPSNEVSITTATHLEIASKVFSIGFRGKSGTNYVTQSSTNLVTWKNVQTNIGNGQVITVDRVNNGGSEFIRVKP